jgi:hypothetical protein
VLKQRFEFRTKGGRGTRSGTHHATKRMLDWHVPTPRHPPSGCNRTEDSNLPTADTTAKQDNLEDTRTGALQDAIAKAQAAGGLSGPSGWPVRFITHIYAYLRLPIGDAKTPRRRIGASPQGNPSSPLLGLARLSGRKNLRNDGLNVPRWAFGPPAMTRAATSQRDVRYQRRKTPCPFASLRLDSFGDK